MDLVVFSKFASAVAGDITKVPPVTPLKQPGVRPPRLKFTTGGSAAKKLQKSLLPPRKRKMV